MCMNLLQVQLSLYKCRCGHLQAGVRYLLLHLLRSVAVSALLQAELALLRELLLAVLLLWAVLLL